MTVKSFNAEVIADICRQASWKKNLDCILVIIPLIGSQTSIQKYKHGSGNFEIKLRISQAEKICL